MVLDGKSSQEYPVNAGVPQRSILGPTLVQLYIYDLPDDVICNIAIYADDTTLYFKCDQTSDLWQQPKLASELESDYEKRFLGQEVTCFFLLRLLSISIDLPYGHAWNTVVMSELLLLVATWNCWISYKNRYAGLLVLHLLPFLNPWHIVEM